ncbi:MAG: hypothetical protein ACRDIY_00510, partial [Chloroflexota bacterium]
PEAEGAAEGHAVMAASADNDSPAPIEEILPSRHVAESDLVSHNGVAPHPSEETLAIPVPAGAIDGREGEHP